MARVATTGGPRFGHTMFRFTNFTMMIYVIFLNAIAARAAKFEKLGSKHDIALPNIRNFTPAADFPFLRSLRFGSHVTNDATGNYYHGATEEVVEPPYSTPKQYALMAHIYYFLRYESLDPVYQDGDEQKFLDDHGMENYTILESKKFTMTDGMYPQDTVQWLTSTLLNNKI